MGRTRRRWGGSGSRRLRSMGSRMTVQKTEGRGLRPGLLIYVVMTAGSGGRFDTGFAAEHGSGDESNDQADGQGLYEGVGHVDEGVLVELLGALYGSHLPGGGDRVKSGGLDLLNLRGEVAVHEVGHEVEIKDLPRSDVADGRD